MCHVPHNHLCLEQSCARGHSTPRGATDRWGRGDRTGSLWAQAVDMCSELYGHGYFSQGFPSLSARFSLHFRCAAATATTMWRPNLLCPDLLPQRAGEGPLVI